VSALLAQGLGKFAENERGFAAAWGSTD